MPKVKKKHFGPEPSVPCRLPTKAGNFLWSLPVIGRDERLYIFTDIVGNYIPATKEREEGLPTSCYEWWNLRRKTGLKPREYPFEAVEELEEALGQRTKYLNLPLPVRRKKAEEIYKLLH